MRTKEGAQDYRYFPEPDLPPFVTMPERIKEITNTIPELPQAKLERFVRDYGLSEYDAKILIASKRDADYAEECIKTCPNRDKKAVVNWLIGPMLSEANLRNSALSDLKISAQALIQLIDFLEQGQVSNLAAKAVLTEMIDTGKQPAVIIKEKNLIQISDAAGLSSVIEEVIKENAKSVADYKSGKTTAIMFLVGQVMKKSQGKANPKAVQEIIKRRLV
jgi:aspartyl-tRNA(Asn)/glutamyl-tRNA(Gln) amidotransferase subunit B